MSLIKDIVCPLNINRNSNNPDNTNKVREVIRAHRKGPNLISRGVAGKKWRWKLSALTQLADSVVPPVTFAVKANVVERETEALRGDWWASFTRAPR